MNYYMHILPGRIRIRTSVLQKNDSGMDYVQRLLRSIEGVSTVHVNSRTGSVLIHFNQRLISSHFILSQLAKTGYAPSINWGLKVRHPKRFLDLSDVEGV
jgi:hypothetical protein